MADAPRCVYCTERPIDPRYRPFCSERCRMADLGRWLRGDYRIPGSRSDETPGDLDGPDSMAVPDGPERTGD